MNTVNAFAHPLCLLLYRREGNKLAAARLRDRRRQMQIDFQALKTTTQNTDAQNKVLAQQVCQLLIRCKQAEQERDFAIQQVQRFNDMMQQRDSIIQTCEQWKDLCAVQREVINQRLSTATHGRVTVSPSGSCMMSDASLSHFP